MKRKTIYVLGYPKSGTTWLSRLLGDALNSPVGGITSEEDDRCIATEGLDRPGGYFIRQGHAVPVESGDTLIPDRFSFAYEHLKDERVVIILRDPRDVAVSAAAHWGMDLEKTLHCMGRGEWPLTHGGGWCEWVRKWQKGPNILWALSTRRFLLEASYKHLSYNTRRGLSELVFNLTDTYLWDELDRVVTRQSITARRAYTEQHGDEQNYGKPLQMRFLRKGVVGDWENHFTLEHRRLAKEYFDKMMRELGYTKDDKWVNE